MVRSEAPHFYQRRRAPAGSLEASVEECFSCEMSCGAMCLHFFTITVSVVALVVASVAHIEASSDPVYATPAMVDDPARGRYPGEMLVLSTSVSPSGYEFVGSVFEGTGQWIRKPALPFALSDHAVASSGNLAFLFGGLNESGALSSRSLVFNGVFEQFAERASMPVPRYRFGAAALDNEVVVVGGFSVVDGPPVASVDVYNIVTNSWSAGPAMSLPRGDLAVVSVAGVVLAIGGYSTDYDMSVSGRLVEALVRPSGANNSVTSWRWEARAPMPTSRGDISAAADRLLGRVFVCGGWNDEMNTFLSAVEMYDVHADMWVSLPALPQPRGDAMVAFFLDHLFVAGGEIWSGTSGPCPWDPSQECPVNEIPLHDVVEMDLAALRENEPVIPAALPWVPRSPLPLSTFRASVAVIDKAIYMFGGHTDNEDAVDDVIVFYESEYPSAFLHQRK